MFLVQRYAAEMRESRVCSFKAIQKSVFKPVLRHETLQTKVLADKMKYDDF